MHRIIFISAVYETLPSQTLNMLSVYHTFMAKTICGPSFSRMQINEFLVLHGSDDIFHGKNLFIVVNSDGSFCYQQVKTIMGCHHVMRHR